MRKKSGYSGGYFDTQPSIRGVFSHHIPAIFCRHAKNVFMDDIEVCWGDDKNEHWSNAMYGENIEQLTLKSFRGASAMENGTAIELKKVSDLSIENSKAKAGTGTFLALENVYPEELFVFGNDFSKSITPVKLSGETKSDYFAANNKMNVACPSGETYK